jgi:magnesium-transporting ATPase (P-type)
LQPVEKLSRERPLSNIFNFYVLLSVLLQFALHIGSMIYITELAHGLEEYVTDLLLGRVARGIGVMLTS